MSDYKLTIIKRVPNPNLSEEIKEQQRRDQEQRYHGVFDQRMNVPLLVEDRVLDVTLTEAEYLAIRKAVLEQFQ